MRHIILAKSKMWFYALIVAIWAIALPALAQTGGKTRLESPLDPALSTIPKFIEGFLKAIVMISLPVITVFFVWSGFLFVMARGNSGQLNKAKENFLWVIIGATLILCAWVLATLIGGTVTQVLR